MPLKGGVRQQLAAGAPPPPPSTDDLPQAGSVRSHSTSGQKRTASLAGFMTSMYPAGRFSAPDLQEGCTAASASGSQDGLVRDLAGSGASGAHRGNMHRDVVSKLGKRCNMPPIYETDIIFWDSDRQCQVKRPMHFLLPHEVIDDQVGKSSLDEWVGFESNPQLQRTLEDHRFPGLIRLQWCIGPWR